MAKYIFEVAGPNCENLLFQVTREKLRGRWEASRVARFIPSEAMRDLNTIPAIPGMHIVVDTSAKKAVIYDPLREDADGQRIWKQVHKVLKTHEYAFGPIYDLSPPVERTLTADDLKTWLFSLRSAYDSGILQKVAGSDELPSVEDIRRMPGKRLTDVNNIGAPLDGVPRYTDEVPVKGEFAGAGKDK